MNLNINRAEYVEVFIPAGNQQQKIYFPDLPNLRTSKIEGIETFSSGFASLKTLTGNTVQDAAQVFNAIVTLYFDGGDFIQVPANSLYRANPDSGYFGNIPVLNGQTIVWAKSYIYLTDSAALASYADKSFLFSVYYRR